MLAFYPVFYVESEIVQSNNRITRIPAKVCARHKSANYRQIYLRTPSIIA